MFSLTESLLIFYLMIQVTLKNLCNHRSQIACNLKNIYHFVKFKINVKNEELFGEKLYPVFGHIIRKW